MLFGDWHDGTDEKGKPVTHHGAIIEGVLFCSQEAYDQLKRYQESKGPATR